MDKDRATVIIGFIFGLLIFAFFHVIDPRSQPFIYWGWPIGAIFGLATCLYLAETWDPYHMQTKPGTRQADMNSIWWVVPAGILAARMIPLFLGEEVGQVLIGCMESWLFITVGYMIIQLWRHR